MTSTARICPICNGTGRLTHFRAAGAEDRRCGCCAGKRTVSAAVWLEAFGAEPRQLTRREAIDRCTLALGLNRDGSRDLTSSGVWSAENGAAGLVADLEESGYGDILLRYLSAFKRAMGPTWTATLLDLVMGVRAVRAEMRASKAA